MPEGSSPETGETRTYRNALKKESKQVAEALRMVTGEIEESLARVLLGQPHPDRPATLGAIHELAGSLSARGKGSPSENAGMVKTALEGANALLSTESREPQAAQAIVDALSRKYRLSASQEE